MCALSCDYKYYNEVQELINFLSINVSDITFTLDGLKKAIDNSHMNGLEKGILKSWLSKNVNSQNITLQIRGTEENDDIIYRVFDMNSVEWNEIMPLAIEPILTVCNVEYILDLSGIVLLEEVDFNEIRKYTDLDYLKLKYNINELDDIDNINTVNDNNSSQIDENTDKPELEERYSDDKDMLEKIKRLKELDII